MPITKPKSISKELNQFLLDNNMDVIIGILLTSDNNNNFFDLSYSDPSKISYLKGDRIPDNASLLYDREYRQSKAYHTKIGKLISGEADNITIQKISALMYTRKAKDSITIKTTSDICYYYHEDNYADGHGVLGNSCMRYHSLQCAIKFYESLGSDKLELLIAIDNNGKLLARALLWHNVIRDDQKIDYLDRIYSNNDNINELFYNYAHNNNIIMRIDNNLSLNFNIHIDDSVPLPYFDTFQYYNIDDCFLSNCGDSIVLDKVDGASIRELHNPIQCHQCSSDLHEDDASYSECDTCYYCASCGIWIDELEDVINVDDCILINNTWYHKESDSIVYSDYYHKYILAEDSCYSDYEDTYFNIDDNDFIYSDHEEGYFIKDNVVYSNYEKDYFLPENAVFIDSENDYYEIDNTVFSKFHNKYILKCDSVYIDWIEDHFLFDDTCIYYDKDSKTYKHKQYILALA